MNMTENTAVKDDFLFEWKIKNFDFCYHENGDCLESPEFKISKFDGTEWKVNLYPRGYDSENIKYMSCYLELFDEDVSSVDIGGTFSIFSVNEQDLQEEGRFDCQTFSESTTNWGYPKFVSVDKIKEINQLNSPESTIILRCHIIRKGPVSRISSSAHNENILSLFFEKAEKPSDAEYLSIKSAFQRRCKNFPVKCVAVTEIGVKTFTTCFTGKLNHQQSEPVIVSDVDLCLFWTIMLESFDDKNNVVIRIRKLSEKTAFAIFKVHMSNKSGNAQHTEMQEHFFDANETWAISFVPDFPEECLTQSFKMDFEIKISSGTEFSYIEKWEYTAPESNQADEIISPDFKKEMLALYSDQTNCDFTMVSSEGKEFHAHKLILSARSLVFKSMFKHDTKENKENRVEIDDIDGDTLHLLLQHIYSSDLQDLETTTALKLYSAADKYRMLQLKEHCGYLLKNKISLSNVIDVLVSADMHSDESLKKGAMDFVVENATGIFASDSWKTFIKEGSHAELLSEVFIRMSQF